MSTLLRHIDSGELTVFVERRRLRAAGCGAWGHGERNIYRRVSESKFTAKFIKGIQKQGVGEDEDTRDLGVSPCTHMRLCKSHWSRAGCGNYTMRAWEKEKEREKNVNTTTTTMRSRVKTFQQTVWSKALYSRCCSFPGLWQENANKGDTEQCQKGTVVRRRGRRFWIPAN